MVTIMFKKIILSWVTLLLLSCISSANAESNKSTKTKNTEPPQVVTFQSLERWLFLHMTFKQGAKWPLFG